jgi:hypothetical protein
MKGLMSILMPLNLEEMELNFELRMYIECSSSVRVF